MKWSAHSRFMSIYLHFLDIANKKNTLCIHTLYQRFQSSLNLITQPNSQLSIGQHFSVDSWPVSNGKVAGKPSHVYYVLCNHAHTSGPGFVDAFYISDRIWYPAKTESLGQCVCPFIAMFAHVVASRKMQIACNQRVFRLIIMRIFFSCIFFFVFAGTERAKCHSHIQQTAAAKTTWSARRIFRYSTPGIIGLCLGRLGAAIFN